MHSAKGIKITFAQYPCNYKLMGRGAYSVWTKAWSRWWRCGGRLFSPPLFFLAFLRYSLPSVRPVHVPGFSLFHSFPVWLVLVRSLVFCFVPLCSCPSVGPGFFLSVSMCRKELDRLVSRLFQKTIQITSFETELLERSLLWLSCCSNTGLNVRPHDME